MSSEGTGKEVGSREKSSKEKVGTVSRDHVLGGTLRVTDPWDIGDPAKGESWNISVWMGECAEMNWE